ncbi:hypothetical protein Tco_1097637 [Tanacetum coccineum]
MVGEKKLIYQTKECVVKWGGIDALLFIVGRAGSARSSKDRKTMDSYTLEVPSNMRFVKDDIMGIKALGLFNLNGSDIVYFIVSHRMFTRRLILKRRVEDLQLGAESYQKKLNITKSQKTFNEIEFKEPYTPLYDPPGIVYEDLDKQKRVLRADELYKFSDDILKFVRD